MTDEELIGIDYSEACSLVRDILHEYPEQKLVEIYNDYAANNGYEEVYPNTEESVNVLLYEKTPYETAVIIANSDWDEISDYVMLQDDGTLLSFDDPLDAIDIYDVSYYLVDENIYCEDDEIRRIIKAYKYDPDDDM